PVARRKTHRHCRTSEESRTVEYPGGRIVVVSRIESNSNVKFNLRLRGVVTPYHTVRPISCGSSRTWVGSRKLANLADINSTQVSQGCPIAALSICVHCQLKTCIRVCRCLCVGHHFVWIDVRRTSDTFPVRDRTANRTLGDMRIKAACSSAVRMV